MGRQLSFYMSGADEIKFKDFILERGKILYNGFNAEPKEISELPMNDEPWWFILNLYNGEGEIVYCSDLEGKKQIDELDSAVVQFLRTIRDDKNRVISQGRLWFELYLYNDKGERIVKSNSLESWYKDLSKWIKKNVPRQEVNIQGILKTVYISDSLYALLEEGYLLK